MGLANEQLSKWAVQILSLFLGEIEVYNAVFCAPQLTWQE